jgi:hypothetical protein
MNSPMKRRTTDKIKIFKSRFSKTNVRSLLIKRPKVDKDRRKKINLLQKSTLEQEDDQFLIN